MANTVLFHRGSPGSTGMVKYKEPQEIPQSKSHACQMKREWSKKFNSDAKLKRKALNKRIKDLVAQKRKVTQSAKSKIRDKHLDIDKMYTTQGKGFRWTELAKKIPWKKQRGRPSGTAPKRYEPGEYVDTDTGYGEEPEYHTITQGTWRSADAEPRQIGTTIVLPPLTRPGGVLLPGQSKPVFRPERALPAPASGRTISPTTRPVLPPGHLETIKRVGPGAVTRPQIGPHIRGLLPAGEQTTKSKMQGLSKRVSKKD